MIIINSTKAAVDLLDKKGALYSDRPTSPTMEMYVISNLASPMTHMPH